MTKPIDLVRGRSPVEFEQVVREAMKDDLSWNIFTADQDASHRAWPILDRWRVDLKRQKALMQAKMEARQITSREFAQWRIKANGFEAALERRLADLPKPYVGSTQPNPGTTSAIRARNYQLVNTLASLASTVEEFLRGDVGTRALDSALDDLTVDMGKHGELSLREALAEGYIPHSDDKERS